MKFTRHGLSALMLVAASLALACSVENTTVPNDSPKPIANGSSSSAPYAATAPAPVAPTPAAASPTAGSAAAPTASPAAAPTATPAAAPTATPAAAPTATPAAASAAPAATPEELGIQPREFSRIVDIVRGARGQVVFLHLYASWCGPCRQEFPEVIALGNRYRAQGLKMVTVSVDERRSDLEAFLKPYNASITFPSYLMTGSQQEFSSGLQALGAHFQGGIPYTAVYGRDGTLVTEWTGSRDMAHFERVIQPLL